jgi:hypothetical protein
MNYKSSLLSLVVVVLFLLIGWTVYAQKQSPARTQWEYRIVNEMEKIQLNDLGAQGWELVAVEMNGAAEVYFFKRQK